MRHKLELHKPSTKLTTYQNSVYYSSTKIHKIPNVIAEFVSDEKCFLIQMKKYLIDKAIYVLEEYVNT